MNDPKFYANNSGLCGMQIRVPYLEDFSPAKPHPKVESKERWFLWERVGIGYAVGFIITVKSKIPWSTKKAKDINY